jgi:polysaccharide biosynthesis protein PslJ
VDFAAAETRRGSAVFAVLVVASLCALAASVYRGESPVPAVAVVTIVTALGVARLLFIGWPRLLVALILVILFIPIRRYALPGNLPFQLEPYRLFTALLLLGWVGSLLVDRRAQIRRTGFEGPLLVIVGAVLASVAVNPGRVAQVSSIVDKQLMFFLSFILVLYFTANVIRRLDSVELLAKALASGGAVVACAAMVEQRTGYNVFNHLHRVIPILRPGAEGQPEAFQKYGAAKLRVFASAQHPIALSAALVVLIPFALYLARRYRQRRWMLAALLLLGGCAATVSRTGVLMLLVVALVFLWLRPRETVRFWPALVVALVVIKLLLPGTLGAIKQSFLPTGGLVAQQKAQPGESGSGRLADLGPALHEWRQQPLLGEGYGTRVVDSDVSRLTANILDDQWLGTLLETGAVGLLGWLWLFVRAVRRFGREAKRDESDRGWLLVSLAAGTAAFAVGMLTYDAFAFVQVTFLLFIFIGLGSALLAQRPTPLGVSAHTR